MPLFILISPQFWRSQNPHSYTSEQHSDSTRQHELSFRYIRMTLCDPSPRSKAVCRILFGRRDSLTFAPHLENTKKLILSWMILQNWCIVQLTKCLKALKHKCFGDEWGLLKTCARLSRRLRQKARKHCVCGPLILPIFLLSCNSSYKLRNFGGTFTLKILQVRTHPAWQSMMYCYIRKLIGITFQYDGRNIWA